MVLHWPPGTGKDNQRMDTLFTAVLLRYVEPGSFDVKDAEAAIDEAAPHCCASIPLNTSNCVSTST